MKKQTWSCAVAAVLVIAGCNKKNDGSAPAAGSAAPAAKAVPAAGAPTPAAPAAQNPAGFTKDTISFKPTGKWVKDDDGKNEVQMWSITNHATAKAFYAHAVIYYYGKDKKPLGRDDIDLAPLNVDAGATLERRMGVFKAKEPAGTEYREAVMTKANFDGDLKFSDPTAAPSTRPMQGS